MARRQAARLGDLLIQAGALSKAQLGSALEMQKQTRGRLGSTLIEMGLVDERTIASVLAQQLQLPSATASQLDRAAKGALERVPRALAERLRAIPIRVDDDRLWVAMVDPTDEHALSDLETATGLVVKPMIVPDVLIDFALGKHYGVKRKTRVVEARNADLLETGPLAVYDPHAPAEVSSQVTALGFLDEPKRLVPPPLPGLRPKAPSKQAAEEPQELSAELIIEPSAKSRRLTPVVHDLRARLLVSQTRDDVYQALLDELVVVAPRLVVLLLRDGKLVGQSARAIDPRLLVGTKIDPSVPILAHALSHGAPYDGPLPHELDALFPGSAGARGLLLPITIGKRPVGIVVGAPLGAAVQKLSLSRIVALVDLALHIAHLRSRLSRA